MSDSVAISTGLRTAGRALVLVAAGYRDLEFWYPVLRFREAGLEVDILGASADDTLHSELGYPVIPDGEIKAADGASCDIVVVPGAAAGEALAADEAAVALVASCAGNGGHVVTIGSGKNLAKAAGVHSMSVEDADGLPPLMRELMHGMGK